MSTDRSKEPSPFAWIFGTALTAIAVAAVARTALGRRRSVPVADEKGQPAPGRGRTES